MGRPAESIWGREVDIICMQNSLVPLKQQIMYLVFSAAALSLLPELFLTITMNSLLPLFEQRKLLWV